VPGSPRRPCRSSAGPRRSPCTAADAPDAGRSRSPPAAGPASPGLRSGRKAWIETYGNTKSKKSINWSGRRQSNPHDQLRLVACSGQLAQLAGHRCARCQPACRMSPLGRWRCVLTLGGRVRVVMRRAGHGSRRSPRSCVQQRAAGICDAGDPDTAGVAADWRVPEMSA